MSDGRPASAHSHHTTSSEHTAASHVPPPAPAPVPVGQAAPIDGDRYKLMFTGPDGVRDHTMRRLDGEFTGTGERSAERTGNLGYLFRGAQHAPFPRGKHGRLGEIGGEIEIWNLKKGL